LSELHHRHCCLTLLIIGLILATASVSAQPAQPPVIPCVPVQLPPHIDGNLDDPVWQNGAWISDFRQSVPRFDEPATETTAVMFAFDQENIYVAVRCDDRHPERIVATKLRHRDDPERDDHVKVIFDTYRDQLRGTVFIVNPLGAKEEGQVNGYHNYNYDWNDVWDVAAVITDRGWQAEFRIPLRVLRFSRNGLPVWGVNVQRDIRHKNEDVFLVPPEPPYDISSLNYAALLEGMTGLRPLRNLQLKPYGLIGQKYSIDTDKTEWEADAGVDLKYSVTSDLTLDVTTNTDFAQVEADDEQVNLSRFSLFFPEKREFFLENAQIFDFGEGGGWGRTALQPFFSRRIGLYEGETVPLHVGARLTGKLGRQDIGVLSVRTGAVDELDLATAYYNVIRVRRNIRGRSYLGGIITDSRRGDFHSTTLGVDGKWWWTPDLFLSGQFLTVLEDGQDEGNNHFRFDLDYTSDPFGYRLTHNEVGENFDPDLGFVRRRGFRQENFSIRRSFRPHAWGIRRVSFRGMGDWYYSKVEDRLESQSAGLQTEVDFDSGDRVEVRINRDFERLFAPFDLDENLVFAKGDYTFWAVDAEFDSSSARPWGVELGATLGQFYDGTQRRLGGELSYIFNPHFRAEVGYSNYHITADHGLIDWDLWSARAEYTHNARLSASAFFQYNSASGAATFNFRVRLIHRNDSDLFIVFDERRIKDLDRWTAEGRDWVIKLNYRFFL